MLAGFKTPRLTQRPSYPLKPGGGAVAVQAGVLWMVYLIYFFDPPQDFPFWLILLRQFAFLCGVVFPVFFPLMKILQALDSQCPQFCYITLQTHI